jgi:UDP-N-acetyl-D-mannosaminuronic acid dehydrogenase
MLPDTLRDKRITIVGLGYVGLTLGVALANAGFYVHGVEVNSDILASLAKGRAHFWEAGLDVHLAGQIKSGRFTCSENFNVDNPADCYIVTVGTPVGEDKRTKKDSMVAVIKGISNVLRDGDMVILRSTVKVGTTRDVVKPILDEIGLNYDLAFCPERTLEGRALQELATLPQVVGGIDTASTFRASQLFSFLTPSIVRVEDPETAEMVKLINNTQRDYTFAFANEVAAMCDALGLSAAEVISGGNLGYPRANLPMPGTVGGPCLEKDPYILAESLEDAGLVPALSIAARQWNETLPNRSVQLVLKEFVARVGRPPASVSVIGLAFKGRPATDDLRGSLAAPLTDLLRKALPDAQLSGWDPLVGPDATSSLGLAPVPTLEAAFKGADIVFVQNNHVVFAEMDLTILSESMNAPGIIYDFWSLHNPRVTILAEGVTYNPLGAFNLTKSTSKVVAIDAAQQPASTGSL